GLLNRTSLAVPAMLLCVLAGIAQPAGASEWSQFRGPGGQGIHRGEVPIAWGPNQNIAWKTRLPGPGASSPIVHRDHVYVTCYTGYGLRDAPQGEMDRLMLHVLCFDRNDGRILWDKPLAPLLPEEPHEGRM